jgi:hypothetical protein
MELGALSVQSFTLNFVQVFVTALILAEDIYSKRGSKLQWALYVMLGFGLSHVLYLMFNKR